MRHHILVKWKEGCKPGLEPIRELFQETLAIPAKKSDLPYYTKEKDSLEIVQQSHSAICPICLL